MRKAWAAWAAGAIALGCAWTAQAGTAVVFYYMPYKNWSSVFMHHNASGRWTDVPGRKMHRTRCEDWAVKTVDLGAVAGFDAVFSDGFGAWDNADRQPGRNYRIRGGVHQVKNGRLYANAGNPCRLKRRFHGVNGFF